MSEHGIVAACPWCSQRYTMSEKAPNAQIQLDLQLMRHINDYHPES